MNPTVSDDRLEQIGRFVRNRLREVAAEQQVKGQDPDYRWQHTLRVSHYGKIIAEAEGANVEVALAACLLHDIAHFDPGDWKDHGRLGAELIRPHLQEFGYSPAQVDNICYSVAAHVDVEQPETLEAKIVTDADNVDRFGAYRTIQWCMGDPDDYSALIAKLKDWILTLRRYRQQDLLQTATGQDLFNHQVDRQIAFFEALIQEHEITVVPRV
jgi:putative nucleotidyltransferase with HDIG domain